MSRNVLEKKKFLQVAAQITIVQLIRRLHQQKKGSVRFGRGDGLILGGLRSTVTYIQLLGNCLTYIKHEHIYKW